MIGGAILAAAWGRLRGTSNYTHHLPARNALNKSLAGGCRIMGVSVADPGVEYDGKKRRTRREKFVARMEESVPWERPEARIRPCHPKAGRGRRPYPLRAMLRVRCVQLFHNPSDPGTEDMLYDT